MPRRTSHRSFKRSAAALGVFACALAILVAPAWAEMPKAQPRGAGKLFAGFEPAAPGPFKPAVSSLEAAKGYDRLILDAAKAKNLTPTPIVSDEAFLRRASVDLIGRIPTAGERNKFLADNSDEKRARLVRSLLASERFVDRMGIFFGDILRVRTTQDHGNALSQYIAQSVRSKTPYDKMVRTMITARGPLGEPAVGFLVAENADPLAMPGVIAQEFLGIRMSCAQCHDHPFDVWTQEEYYNIAAYFGRTSFYQREKPYKIVRVGMTSESSVMWPAKPDKDHPAKRVKPSWPMQLLPEKDPHAVMLTSLRAKRAERPANVKADEEMDELIAKPVSDSRGMVKGMESDAATVARITAGDTDREALADLITGPRNRFFAWHLVNRLWAEFVGTPIVDPVDDFRTDNPPSNPELLNRLADEFVASGYDLRFLIESILMTEAYQRQMMPGDTASRKASERAFVAAPLRRLGAEALYDSIVIAGHLEDFKHPEGANLHTVTYTVTDRRLKASKMEPKKPEAAVAVQANAGKTDTPKPDAAKGDGAMMMTATDGNAGPEKKPAAPANPEKPRTENRDAMAAIPDIGADPETMMVTGAPSRYASEEIEKGVQQSFMEMDQRAARESEMVAMMASEENVEYVTRKVTEVRDENPKFSPASDMAAPAPSDHMLRQFGQSARATLGESRDRKPNTRQSLILLNGRLVNQAARVGPLEPMGALMSDKKPLALAIELAYVETLTRKPTPAEAAAAESLVQAAGNRKDGIADLRWVLLNALEFRYLH